MSNRSGGSISQPLLSIRSYNALTKKKVVSDSVIPPWQTDHTPTGELAMHEYRKNLINPHEDVLNGTYQLPMPNEKTGHWGDKTQSRPEPPRDTADAPAIFLPLAIVTRTTHISITF